MDQKRGVLWEFSKYFSWLSHNEDQSSRSYRGKRTSSWFQNKFHCPYSQLRCHMVLKSKLVKYGKPRFATLIQHLKKNSLKSIKVKYDLNFCQFITFITASTIEPSITETNWNLLGTQTVSIVATVRTVARILKIYKFTCFNLANILP